jgi:SAM-dependent methyltransferase
MTVRSLLKCFIPERILKSYQKAQAYRRKLWGKKEGEDFFSDGGSLERFAVPYANWTIGFVMEHGIRTVVDLGCGDFRVGRRICEGSGVRYIGVDIVPDLIAHNQSKFAVNGVAFKCANVIEDELPNGDLCLIRKCFSIDEF